MTIAKTSLNVELEAEINYQGQDGINQDVMDTQAAQKMTLLDNIENRAHILEGSMAMAMDVADERHSGFWSGMMEQLSMLVRDVNKMRQ